MFSSQRSGTHLFSKARWSDAIRHNETKLAEKARSMSLQQIGDDVESCATKLAEEFDFAPPKLDTANIAADPVEIDQVIEDYGQRRTVKRQAVEVTVPYSGERDVFNLRPSHSNFSFPHVILSDGELVFRILVGERDSTQLRAEIDQQVADIQWFLDQQQNDAVGQTEKLVGIARRELSARQAELRKGGDVVSGLGFKSKNL